MKSEESHMSQITKLELEEKTKQNIEYALDKSTMIAITDHKGTIQKVNDKFCEISKYTEEELVNHSIQITYSDDHSQEFYNQLWKLIETGEIWQGEIKSLKKDGTYYWVDTTIIPFLDEKGIVYQHILLQQDITERKEYDLIIKDMAYSDPLTKLPNRNYIRKWATEYRHNANEEITVMFIDIDRFKIINDNFGHAAGDNVLITISERLKSRTGDDGVIFKLGGEEFIIIMQNKSKEDIKIVIDKVFEAIREPIQFNNIQLLMTPSIGISSDLSYSEDTNFFESMNDLIKKADTAMYYAKRQGGNQYHIHTINESLEMERYYQIELEIREALDRDEFSLVYQPLLNLKTNKIVGVESLLRWNNRLLGSVSPGEFIPILEETGFIMKVGKWVLKNVCNQMKEWQEQDVFLQRITVNVSPVQFKNPSFVSDLNNILNEAELDASYLEIEITEGTLIDIKDSANKLQDLQELGVKVSIDDFGTGYSSLSYLKKLPIDTLKIDKSFIDDLDRDGEIIVNTIISMGKNLQFRVIAEGIENSEQFKYLQEQECHEGQGYFFSRPVESNKIEELYHSFQ